MNHLSNTNSTVVLKHYKTIFYNEVMPNGQVLDLLFQLIKQYSQGNNINPDSLYISSSSELFVFSDNSVLVFFKSLCSYFINCPVVFLAQACLCLNASILDFIKSDFRRSFIILLEYPLEYQQHCLDAVGIGTGGLGLQGVEGCGFAYVEKILPEEVRTSDMIISDCQILTVPHGISSTIQLSRKITQHLMKIRRKQIFKIISFQLPIEWSEQLTKALDRILPEDVSSKHWIPSCETERTHFLTLKPLLELQRHSNILVIDKEVGINILTLGAMGRVGSLFISLKNNGMKFDTFNGRTTYYEYDFYCELDEYMSISKKYGETNDLLWLHKQIRQRLKYMSREKERRDNEYYIWRTK
jgi:hypothetical protein